MGEFSPVDGRHPTRHRHKFSRTQQRASPRRLHHLVLGRLHRTNSGERVLNHHPSVLPTEGNGGRTPVADKNEITRRWEEGVDHDPRSIEIFKAIAKIDFEIGGDYFCWKHGGDGDNGEHLLFELDIYFASLDPPPDEELEVAPASIEAMDAAADAARARAHAALDEDRVLFDVTEISALREEITLLKATITARDARINDLTEALIGEMTVDQARIRAAMDESTKELSSKLADADAKIATMERERAILDDGDALIHRVYDAFLASFRDAGDKMSGLSHYRDYVQSRWAQNLRIALGGGTNFIRPT